MNCAETIFYNGEVITLDSQNTICEAVAVAEGRIAFIGSNRDALKLAANGAEMVDLKGQTLLPGFFDSHVHLVQTGLNMLGIDLSSAKSIKEILNIIALAIKDVPAGELIWGYGVDETQLQEKRMPTRYELDWVSPDHPLIINRVEYHTVSVNSYTYHLLHLPFNLEGIEKNPEGVPTGILKRHANSLARKKFAELIPEKVRINALHLAVDQALKAGITTAVAMEGGFIFHDMDAELILRCKDSLPIDVEVFYQTSDVEKVLQKNLKHIGCIFLDGTFGSRTAALNVPYADDPQNNGRLYFSQEEVDSFVIDAHRSGLQIAIHAIGERAIEQAISAYQRAIDKYPRDDHRHRLEHCELPLLRHIARARELGLIISVQPAYEYVWGGKGKMYDARLGEERRKKTNPLRTLVDKGALVVGGSDSDITPMRPMLGIHSAVNHPTAEQRLTPEEALRLFTINAARGVFLEKEKGTIEVGKLADFAVLVKNPLRVDPKTLKDIEVSMTVKEGNILYKKTV